MCSVKEGFVSRILIVCEVTVLSHKSDTDYTDINVTGILMYLQYRQKNGK